MATLVSGVGPGMGVLDGWRSSKGRGSFWVNVGHPIATDGTLWRSYSRPWGVATRLFPNYFGISCFHCYVKMVWVSLEMCFYVSVFLRKGCVFIAVFRLSVCLLSLPVRSTFVPNGRAENKKNFNRVFLQIKQVITIIESRLHPSP